MSFRQWSKKKNINKKIEKTTEILDATSDALSLINPAFVGIPIITYVINRVMGCMSEERIKERIDKIAYKLEEKKINQDEFKRKIKKMTEHNEYVVRNHLNNILLNCIPETVDAYIGVLIEIVLNQENSIYEELCEIINQLNKNDFQLLKMIKEYKVSGTREIYEQNVKKREDETIERKNESRNGGVHLQRINFKDKDTDIGENTIFWNDFAKAYGISSISFEYMLLKEITVEAEDGEKIEWKYLARSFIKLEKLGIIEIDHINTTGTINSMNINRFHITVFGAKLMEYIN